MKSFKLKSLVGVMMAFCMLISLSSCAKPAPEPTLSAQAVFEKVRTVDTSITFAAVDYALQSPVDLDTCYRQTDLSDLIQYYGTDYSDAPEVVPCFNNYYQDIFGGNDGIANVTLVDDLRLDLATDDLRNKFNYLWIWDDLSGNQTIIGTGYSPLYSTLDFDCDGAGDLTLIVQDTTTGATFVRTEPSFIDYVGITNCENGLSATYTVGVMSTIPPTDYTPYSFLEYPVHLDDPLDRIINTEDVMNLLPKLCN